MVYDFYVPIGGDPVKKQEQLRSNMAQAIKLRTEKDLEWLSELKVAPVEFQYKARGHQMMVRIKPDEVGNDTNTQHDSKTPA